MENILLSKEDLEKILKENIKSLIKEFNIDCTIEDKRIKNIVNESLISAFLKNNSSKPSVSSELYNYFNSLIGSKVRKSLTTGNKSFTEVYKRQYIFEVLSVSEKEVRFHVSSKNICPAGCYEDSMEDNDFGEISIDIRGKDRISILNEAIMAKDKSFIDKYNLKL